MVVVVFCTFHACAVYRNPHLNLNLQEKTSSEYCTMYVYFKIGYQVLRIPFSVFLSFSFSLLVFAFRSYKVPDGKPENKFALEERCMGRSYAMKVVSECHMAWRNLVGKAEQGDVKSNLSVSRLSDMGSDIELDAAARAFEDEEEGEGRAEGEGAGAGDEDGEYPTSLIA